MHRDRTPRTVYLIGDSIAAGYATGVQAELAGGIVVELRPENGEDSRHVLARLGEWLGDRHYDAIHFNCGLHDIKRPHGTGEYLVTLAEYEANLRQIVAKLRQHTNRLIWARTTPVLDGQPVVKKGFDRYNQDVVAYNRAADRVMADCSVPMNDLHQAVVAAGVTQCLSADGVHMTDWGYAVLSRRVAAAIRGVLAVNPEITCCTGESMEARVESGASKLGSGIVVPMVTPFTPAGDLDEPAVRRVVEHLLAGGVAGIFVLGTTGEDASMPAPMRGRLVAVAVEQAAGRAATYAGISGNCLAESVAAAHEYRRLGVDVLVARLPTYFALNGDEQQTYFETLLEQVPGPLMLYNIAGTTHMAIPIPVVEVLSRHPKVIGLKDSDADLPRLEELVRRLGGRADFALLCGVTAWSTRALTLGADGCVPSTANLVPEVCQRLYDSFHRGDLPAAEAYQQNLDKLATFLRAGQSLAQSIGSLKAAMGALGLCGPAVLPPLVTPSPEQQQAVQAAFRRWQAP